MTLPRFPLRDRLNDPANDPALARIWEGIDSRFPRRRHRRAPTVVVLSAVAAMGVVAGFWLHPHPDAGPLRTADGQPLATVEAPATGAVVALSDGSQIKLSGGARLQPLESSGTSFVATLTSGSADFSVKPGGPRRWRVACGLATVEVVGTQFTCAREPGRLRVAVQHGSVLVAGERVPDRIQGLQAGQSLLITDGTESVEDADATPPAAEAPAPPAAATPPPETGAAETAPRPARAAVTPTWRELARRGRHQEAFAALGTAGLRREAGRLGVGDLFALADVARLSGHPTEAEAPLARIVSEFAHDPQAPLAAFALGRLDLDVLGHPHQAAAAFSRALTLGIPHGLREDVRGRLVEAYARAGETASAREAADAYAREFPDGRYAKAIAAQLSRTQPSSRP